MKKKIDDDVSDTEVEIDNEDKEDKEDKDEESEEKDDSVSDEDDKLSDGMDIDDDEEDARCFYKFVDNEEDEKDEDEFDDDDLTEMIEEPVIKTRYVDANSRITHPHMTKYEYVRILGDRMMQLSNGAKPLIKNYGEMSIKEIAHNEIINGVCPFKIERPLPNGDIEVWSVGELGKTVI